MLTINRLLCLRLNTAGMVIGWLGVALSVLNIVIYSVILSMADEIVKFVTEDNKNVVPDVSPDLFKSVLLIAVSILLVLSLTNFFSSAFLIAGTMRERHLMLVPWLINNGVNIFISVVHGLIVVWISIENGNADFFLVTLFLISYLVCYFFVWTAIYSLFRNIRIKRDERLVADKSETAYPSYTKI